MSLDAVVVHYGSAEQLRDCIASIDSSLRRVGATDYAIVVVDNDAPEAVPEAIAARAGVSVVRPGRNLGFAAGANLGARHADGAYLLIVNPDVCVDATVIRAMRDALADDDRLAACAPALRHPDGTLQVGAAGHLPSLGSVWRQAFPLTRLFGGRGGRSLFVPAIEAAADAPPAAVDWLSAACLLVRREAFDAVGGFDERFFLYGEDIDLGKRLGEAGWRLTLLPSLTVEHTHLQADRERVHRAADDAWLDGLDLYYRLHMPRARRLLHAIGWGGFAARALVATLPRGHAAARRLRRERMVAFMRRSAHHALAS